MMPMPERTDISSRIFAERQPSRKFLQALLVPLFRLAQDQPGEVAGGGQFLTKGKLLGLQYPGDAVGQGGETAVPPQHRVCRLDERKLPAQLGEDGCRRSLRSETVVVQAVLQQEAVPLHVTGPPARDLGLLQQAHLVTGMDQEGPTASPA